MSAKINFLIIQCRDFNFPHAGYIDVKLIRVKHQIKIKVIHYLPKTLGRKVATYYMSNTEHFVFSSIIHKTVDKVYDEIVERLNYTDKFISHYGYSDGDVAGAYDSVIDYSEWLTLTLFSFNSAEKPLGFPTMTELKTFSRVSETMGHSTDAIGMTSRIMHKSAHLFGEAMDIPRVDTSIRGGKEPLKELKVSPLAKSSMLDKFLGDKSFSAEIKPTPELLEELKKFGAK